MPGRLHNRYIRKKGERRRRPRIQISHGIVGYKPRMHTFRRSISQVLPIYDTAGLANYAADFKLSLLPNASEFTALFDCYRIMNIKGQFIFDMNSAGMKGTAGSCLPNLIYVKDYDDASPLSVIYDYQQYESMKIKRMDKTIRMSFHPRPVSPVYGGGAFTSWAVNSTNPWIDTANNAVSYYGLKFAIDPVQNGAGANLMGQLTIYYTYTIQCKEVK